MTTKERPITFRGPMVRAILEGKKTQTRRLIKPQPDEDGLAKVLSTGKWYDTSGKAYHCPYGKRGGQLWVRETWAENLGTAGGIIYRADYGDKCSSMAMLDLARQEWTHHLDRWKSPIFMPRRASRITLEITSVRVQRLQQISEADALVEGCPLVNPDPFIKGHGGSSASGWFSDFWESINGEGSWDANPWVWVLEFQRLPEGGCYLLPSNSPFTYPSHT